MPTLLETVLSNSLAAGLLGVLAFVASRWRQPALAHGLWLLVMIKLVTPPLIPLNVAAWNWNPPNAVSQAPEKAGAIPAQLDALSLEEIATVLALSEKAEEPEVSTNSYPSSEPAAGPSWQECILPLWLGGTLLWLGITCGAVFQFQRLLRSARPATVGLQNEVRRLASRLGLAHCPSVWIVPGAVSPMIWSVGTAPRLIFPSALLNRLGTEQREALLLHELAHVRRRDHWVRLIELAVNSLYWWHPLVWLARRELRESEEQCCDAWVVWASGGEGQAYARALLEAVAFVSHTRCPLPAAASGIGHVSHLRRRLTMIMRGNTPKSLSALGWLVVLALGLSLLPLAARAQTPQKSDDIQDEVTALKEGLKALEGLKVQKEEDEAADLIVNLLEDEDADVKATVAELKKLIKAKQAELNDLQAKLVATIGKVEATKAKKEATKANKDKGKGMPDPRTMIDLGVTSKADMKQLGEQIEKAIRENPALKQLEELKKLGKLDELKKLEDLKKLGDMHIDFKGLDDIKKQVHEIKGLDQKQLEEMKKMAKMHFDLANVAKDKTDKVIKEKGRKTDDVDARLDRLMNEIGQIRKEIHEMKDKQSK